MNENSKPVNPSSIFFKARKFAGVIEIAMVVIASFVLYQFLRKYIQDGIASTDVILYMNLGLNNLKDTFVLNRYVHIFLQKLFLETAVTPFVGEHNYWSFLVASTAALTYWNARLLFYRRSILRGICAVLIFLSINIFLQFSSSVMPDFSVMLMINIFLLIYLASINQGNRSRSLLVFLGMVFYLAFKTKETSLFPMIILLPGIGFIAERFDLRFFKKNAIFFLTGLLLGVLSFALLSGLILKDPFWGLRLGEIKDFLGTYGGATKDAISSQQSDYQNWYSSFLLGSITFPFVFYLLSGSTAVSGVNIPRRLVWLMPLAAIAFIIPLTMVSWGGRFFMPILPVVSILGSGLVNEDVLVKNKAAIFKTSLLVFLGLVLYAGIRLGMRYTLAPLGYNLVYVLNVVINPLLFTALLAIFFLVPRSSNFRNLVLFLLLLFLTMPIMINNFKTANYFPLHDKHYEEAIYPFTAFSGEIQYSPAMRLATSTNVWISDLTKNIDELMCLFNVYFDAGATRESFIFTADLDQLVSQAMDQDFDYILITTEEWDHILSQPSMLTDIQASYRMLTEDRGKIVLLARK